MIRIKVCGMLDPVNIGAIAALKPDFMGFIFYPGSKRYAGKEPAASVKHCCKDIKKVGVFVNDDYSRVLEYMNIFGLDLVQLHGSENPEFCFRLKDCGTSVIKVFHVKGNLDGHIFEPFEGACDYFLFDTATPCFGGSGSKFNWQLLERYNRETPFFLSGGIGPEDIDEILKIKNQAFYGIDINSRFETKPGWKDTEKVKTLINKINTGSNEI